MPFTSTTFPHAQFPDRRPGQHWRQSDGLGDGAVGVSGDGISGSGGWTTSNGSMDEICTAANNPLGEGKGFRHWMGNGSNNGGGGIRLLFAPTAEFWMRYYIRYQLGFAWGSHIGHKHWYNQTSGSGFYHGLNSNQLGAHLNSDSINRFSTVTWQDLQGGQTSNGLFKCIEFHVKRNTPPLNNGVYEIWVDGVQVYSVNTCKFVSASAPLWDSIFTSNHNNPNNPTDYFCDYDDIAISTTGYIGPIGMPPPVIGEPVQNTINWSYDAADETMYAVTHFILERKAEACAGAGAYAEIAQPAAGQRSYVDNAVSGGVTYCYRMAAVGAGGTSPYSNSAERLVTFDAPVAPVILSVS